MSNKNTRGEKHDWNNSHNIMGMLRNLRHMVLHISKTLRAPNTKRGKNALENPQANSQMRRKKMAGNSPRQENSWFYMRMRI